jgi:hypothetical protein
VIDWLNANAGAVQAMATIVLVAITAWYAHLTLRLARSAERTELAGQQQSAWAASRAAEELLRDVAEFRRHASSELHTKMFGEDWRALRDAMEADGLAAGGGISRAAGDAARHLRKWEELWRDRPTRREPGGNDALNAELAAAEAALKRLAERA